MIMSMKGGCRLQSSSCFIMRVLCMLLTMLMLTSPFTAYADYDPEHPELLTDGDIAATAYILIEQSTGNVILERLPDQPMYPASTTKIMTVLLVPVLYCWWAERKLKKNQDVFQNPNR